MAVAREVPCTHCGYDLRAPAGERGPDGPAACIVTCPECGGRVDLAVARRRVSGRELAACWLSAFVPLALIVLMGMVLPAGILRSVVEGLTLDATRALMIVAGIAHTMINGFWIGGLSPRSTKGTAAAVVGLVLLTLFLDGIATMMVCGAWL